MMLILMVMRENSTLEIDLSRHFGKEVIFRTQPTIDPLTTPFLVAGGLGGGDGGGAPIALGSEEERLDGWRGTAEDAEVDLDEGPGVDGRRVSHRFR